MSVHGSAEHVASVGHVRVSVIVPVFNPGAGFDDLIRSLGRQTLAPENFEVLLCDDGSGEATRDRLAQVAREHANVRVLNLPHTGWPGTPRNHGIEAARGDYVFFSDQDDWLFDHALEALCDYADQHSSDVVIGKVVGIGRRIPRQIFRKDVPHAVLGTDPLLELLTPHKLFRTEFLRHNGIRFPDGRVRLEDHMFVMQAYFAARTISILASEPCYAWVKNAGSASSSRIDPDTYFPHLETVLEIVEANTEPGTVRDTLLRHWYRGKILKRIEGRRMVRYPDAYRERFLDVVTPIAQRWFGGGVEQGLAFPLRIRSALLRAGRREDLLRLAEWEAGLECRAEVASAQWTRAGKLKLTIDIRFVRDGADAALVFEPGEPAAVVSPTEAASPAIWRPPADLASDALPPEVRDAGRDLRRDRVDVFLRDTGTDAEHRVAGRAQPNVTQVTVTIDPVEVFTDGGASAGGPLVARVRHAGWTFETPLRADPATLEGAKYPPAFTGQRCRLVATSDGIVGLRPEGPAGRLRSRAAGGMRRLRSLARRVLPGRVWSALSRARRAVTSRRR